MLIDSLAPEFEVEACMPDDSFKTLKLSDFKGKYVIVFFYPGDFTFVCNSEVAGFNKLYDEYVSKNCVILGVSTDSKHSHKAWKLLALEQGGAGPLKFPLLGDFNHKMATDYDVLLPDGTCARGVFLIDKEGYVRAEHKNCDPLGRSMDEPMRLLDALQFHEDSIAKGMKQVCPASWKKGKKAITPTLEGVGEYYKAGGRDEILAA